MTQIYYGKIPASSQRVKDCRRAGKRAKGPEVVSILKRLVSQIREVWPKTKILLRGDGHFSTPEVLDFCETAGMTYILGLAVNKRLAKSVSMDLAQRAYDVLGEKVRLFEECFYQAGKWSKPRRVITKAEVTAKGQNSRAIVTNLKGKKAKRLYCQTYCARGRMENFIKDHKNVLHSDRTSCHKFEANQFRLFLHSAAYTLVHTLQHRGLKGTEFAKAQFDTIRLKVLKVGARVVEKATRIKFHFPAAFPLKHIWATMAENLAISFP